MRATGGTNACQSRRLQAVHDIYLDNIEFDRNMKKNKDDGVERVTRIELRKNAKIEVPRFSY